MTVIFPNKTNVRQFSSDGLMHTSKVCVNINDTKITQLKAFGQRQPMAEAYVLAQINIINLGLAGEKGRILY